MIDPETRIYLDTTILVYATSDSEAKRNNIETLKREIEEFTSRIRNLESEFDKLSSTQLGEKQMERVRNKLTEQWTEFSTKLQNCKEQLAERESLEELIFASRDLLVLLRSQRLNVVISAFVYGEYIARIPEHVLKSEILSKLPRNIRYKGYRREDALAYATVYNELAAVRDFSGAIRQKMKVDALIITQAQETKNKHPVILVTYDVGMANCARAVGIQAMNAAELLASLTPTTLQSSQGVLFPSQSKNA